MADTKVPPRAFKGGIENKIIAAIREIAATINRLAKPAFTADELLDLFVDPHYHKLLRNSFAEAQGAGIGHNIYVDLAAFNTADFEVSGQLQFGWFHHTVPDGFFPRAKAGGRTQYPIRELLPTCPGATREKFLDTIERLTRVSYEWGIVLRMYNELNQPGYCATPHQMRYVWPSILPILKRCKDEERLVAELQHESLRAGDKARVPLPMQPFLRESYDVVTRAILMTEHDAPDRTAGISYSLINAKFGAHGIAIEGYM